ncbi:MAG: helix-turn-helix domain-containing protein [Paracoccaceae bacterium]
MASQSMSSVDDFIGRRIRQFRWVRGVSQADLAKRLSVEPAQIKAYENGTSRVEAAQLFQVSGALDVPVSAFFEGMGDSPESEQTGTRDDLSAREAQMLSDFKRMSHRQQDAILSMAQTFADQLHDKSRSLPAKAREG